MVSVSSKLYRTKQPAEQSFKYMSNVLRLKNGGMNYKQTPKVVLKLPTVAQLRPTILRLKQELIFTHKWKTGQEFKPNDLALQIPVPNPAVPLIYVRKVRHTEIYHLRFL